MNESSQPEIPRGQIGIRLVLTLLFLVILSLVHFLIQLITVVQYIMLLVNRRYSEPLRSFSNKAAAYMYRLVRYVTLNENTRPFPFTEFPPEMEHPEGDVKYD